MEENLKKATPSWLRKLKIALSLLMVFVGAAGSWAAFICWVMGVSAIGAVALFLVSASLAFVGERGLRDIPFSDRKFCSLFGSFMRRGFRLF